MANPRICSIDGCDNPAMARGWCGKHYMRWKSHGDPNVCKVEKGGQLRYLKKTIVQFDSDECLIWPFDKNVNGYGRVKIKGIRRAAHRVVCEIAHGLPPNDGIYDAAHSCGTRACINKRHLRWATPKENSQEKIVHGTIARGERNGNAVMTKESAMTALELKGKMTQREIAERLGITRSSVRDIHIGKSWAWLRGSV